MTDNKIDGSADQTSPNNCQPVTRIQRIFARTDTMIHIVRFAVVGISATAVHLGVALCLNMAIGISALVSNIIAFCCALLVSYFGNLKWVFRVKEQNKFRAGKFLITALSGFFLNNTILVLLITQGLMADALAIVVSVFCVPLITFVAFKFWVFAR
ncbi:MAG: GtrA family protein [Porticoccaceae bacterium]|nr:GtrA family protein [Porticoccaceae bacterium]